MHQFLQIYNTVMAVDYHQNFVSAHCLEEELMKFDQISHKSMH